MIYGNRTMFTPNIFSAHTQIKLKCVINHTKEISETGYIERRYKKNCTNTSLWLKIWIVTQSVKCLTEHVKFKPNYIFQRKKWHTLEYKPKIPCNQSFSLDSQQYLKMLMRSGSSRIRPTRQSMPIPTPPMATALGRASYTLIRLRV